jgi:dephospho-CoA kinase
MLVVALTGGIATGKSLIAQVWEQLGCFIHESDTLAHQLQAPNKPAWKAIVSHFGEKILNQNKTINRQALGDIVFSDAREREFLDRLLHPMVMGEKKELIAKIRQKGQHKIFVSVAALTIEAGYAEFYDKIVVAHCEKEIQIIRLMERDAIDRKGALEKIDSQLPPEKKLPFADYTIDTSGSIRETVEKAEKVYRNLVDDYQFKLSVEA